ncbi:MAG: RloB family protein [Candidatus Competibacteraceae bacterium]|jgi:hypothetical protein|nr:RloB family protein [Candidatus Competibacteraceae bacterium]
MGSNDLFKKRKAQKAAELERRQRDRVAGPRFLIVCEGMKTEPFYFQELCEFHQLRTSRVRVEPGQTGSSPDRVVAYAKQLYAEDAQLGVDPYDYVFCVIDHDQHSTYQAALARIKQLGKPFKAVPSEPCFEYWLLLHFIYTRQPFAKKGRCSSCDVVIHELRKQSGFNAYAKAQRDIYSQSRHRIDTAIRHAQKVEQDVELSGQQNPSTHVHHLVQQLLELAKTHGRRC